MRGQKAKITITSYMGRIGKFDKWGPLRRGTWVEIVSSKPCVVNGGEFIKVRVLDGKYKDKVGHYPVMFLQIESPLEQLAREA